VLTSAWFEPRSEIANADFCGYSQSILLLSGELSPPGIYPLSLLGLILDAQRSGQILQRHNRTNCRRAPEFGWFGVTRDPKFVETYFAKLYLPEWMALSFLYTFAILEIVIGLTFLLILLWRKMPSVYRRLVFKASMFIFLVFSVGDILFGDRQELWEHGTFMVLTLVTYQMYIGRSQERADIVGADFDRLDTNHNRRLDTGEDNEFLRNSQQRPKDD